MDYWAPSLYSSCHLCWASAGYCDCFPTRKTRWRSSCPPARSYRIAGSVAVAVPALVDCAAGSCRVLLSACCGATFAGEPDHRHWSSQIPDSAGSCAHHRFRLGVFDDAVAIDQSGCSFAKAIHSDRRGPNRRAGR